MNRHIVKEGVYTHSYMHIHTPGALQTVHLSGDYTVIFVCPFQCFSLIEYLRWDPAFTYRVIKNNVYLAFSILKTFSQANLRRFETDSFHYFLPIIFSN